MMLEECLKNGREYREERLCMTHGREVFDANDFYRIFGKWKVKFVKTLGKVCVPMVCGDEVESATYMYEKYSALASEYYVGEVDADIITEENNYEKLGE